MKFLRTILPYFTVILLIGGYIYFFERKPVPSEAEKKGRVLPDFVSDDVVAIRLEAFGTTLPAGKEPLVLEKDAQGTWQITAPRKYKADESNVRSALTMAGELAPETTLKEPAGLSAYGLDPASHKVTFQMKDGKSRQFLVGAKDMQGTAYYLQSEGSKEVLLVMISSVDGILRKIEDYRDHAFFKPDPIVARKVRVTHGGKALQLEKDGQGHWRLVSPLKAKASESKVRDVLSSIGTLRANGFEKDDPASLAPYGLAPAEGSIEVWLQDDPKAKSILVGRKKKGTSEVYAKQGDLPYVTVIPEFFKTNTIQFKVEDFRDKDAMKFDSGFAQGLTLTKGKEVLSYKKDSQGQWSAEGRGGAQAQAGDLVAHLSQTAVLEFAPSALSVTAPAYKAELSLSDGTQRIFRFGAKAKDRVLLASDQGPEAYWVSSEVLPKLEACFKGPSTPIPLPAASPTP